jgi:D-3-phosphoglycerate dehydrogenase
MKPTVLLAESIAPRGVDLLERECTCLVPTAGQEAATLLSRADAVVVRLFEVRDEDMENAPRLKVIAKHGVGVDNVDVEAATRRGIAVTITGTANSNAVAEHSLALMLALIRLPEGARQAVREARFHERDRYAGVELAGKTLGIVGLGRIGSRVARKAALGLEMKVCAYDPLLDPGQYNGPAELVPSLEDVLRRCDVLSLHVPLTEQTHQMINPSTLALLKPHCRIINTSRGAVIDEAALARALHDGAVAGAALDVFAEEPPSPDHPLCHTPGTLLSPHLASSTPEARDGMSRTVAENVLAVLRGERAPDALNPEIYDGSDAPGG